MTALLGSGSQMLMGSISILDDAPQPH